MLSQTKTLLYKTLMASTLYEMLVCIRLLIIKGLLTPHDVSQYILLICISTLLSKFFDAGMGCAYAGLLKKIPYKALYSTVLQQAFIIVPLSSVIFFYFYPSCPGLDTTMLFLVIICAVIESFCTLARHALYATLKSESIMLTELGIMLLNITTLIIIATLFPVSMRCHLAYCHVVFFLTLTALAFTYRGNWHQLTKISPIHAGVSAHKTVATLRLQTFSTKIGKDLLSTYALTPLFSFINGTTYTWLFFFLTSMITSFITIIKMSIGYTAVGAFVQLPKEQHPQVLRAFNRTLGILIFIILFIVAVSCYALLTLYPEAIFYNTIAYALCFSLIACFDILPLVYEQYLLVSSHYTIYQKLRLTEYASIGLVIWLAGNNIILATIALLACKITIFIIIRKKIYTLISGFSPGRRSSPRPPHVATPTFRPPPTPHTHVPHPQAHELSSSKARGRAGERSPGAARRFYNEIR